MEIETIEKKTIKGLRIRTSNKIEVDAATGQIPGLWNLFDNNVDFDFEGGSRVYGVYYDYDSDASGEFDVLVGTDQLDVESVLNLETVDINAGRYAVFHSTGEMPHTVMEAWGDVWKYFSQPDAKYKRAYTTDFEFYVDKDEVKIYIAIE